MKISFKSLLILMLVCFLNVSALAIDVNDLGDFASRSILLNPKNSSLTQEQKDILTYKKLAPNTYCLIKQIEKKKNDNVALLLDFGVNPNQSYYAEYPIYIAARENNFEALQLLYDKGAKLDKGFNSELYMALKNKNEAMAQYLLDRNANIHYIDSITQNTILYMALKGEMYNIAQQLINKGAKADRKSVVYIKKKKLMYLIEGKIN